MSSHSLVAYTEKLKEEKLMISFLHLSCDDDDDEIAYFSMR